MKQNLSITYMSPEQLNKNPWNPNVMTPANEEKLEKSVEELGEFKPVIVRELEDGSLQILGGEHRCDVAKKRGMQVPVINLGKMSDERAQKITLADNARYGDDDSFKLTELLVDLGDASDIAEILPYTEQNINDLLGSTEIDLDALGDSDEEDPLDDYDFSDKTATKTHSVLRFKFPLEATEYVSEVIEARIRDLGLSDPDKELNAGDALLSLLKDYFSYTSK